MRILSTGQPHQTGLVLAHIGSAFDVPVSLADEKSTMAATSYMPSFNQSEKAVRIQPFNTFYTANQTTGGQEPVQFKT